MSSSRQSKAALHEAQATDSKAPAAARGMAARLGSQAAVLGLQWAAGNRAVNRLLGGAPGQAPPIVEKALKSGNQPLDPVTQSFMEERFGENFDQVRVHTDSSAADSAQALDARAYTTGQDIVFSHGAYDLSTQKGHVLLAHELAHVVQQSKNSSNTQRESFSRPNDSSEREATQIAQQAATGTQTRFSVNQAAPIGQVQTQGSEKAGTVWEKVKGWISAESDEEAILKELNDGLDRSQKLCERASIIVSNPEAAERLKIASEKFEGVTKVIGKVLQIRAAARDITKFIDAIETLENLDIQKDPEKAAKAFGKLFASAGRLGQLLPGGPWTEYFEFLAGMEGFFTNMRRGFRPTGWQQLREIGIGEEGE